MEETVKVSKRLHHKKADHPYAEFYWTRPIVPRFEWLDGQPATSAGAQSADERRWLISDLGPTTNISKYSPLVEEPALFRNFAEVTPTEVGFQRFANDYGILLPHQIFVLPDRQMASGVSLSRYREEHDAMKRVVCVIDALRNKRKLLPVAKRVLEEARPAVGSNPDSFKFSEGTLRPAIRCGDFNSLRAACTTWLELAINTRLRAPGPVGDSVIVTMQQRERRLVLRQVPRSLLAAMWLQCALAAEGEHQFRRCQPCGNWFLISPEGTGKRRQAIYCSRRCNVRACRKRNRPTQSGQVSKKKRRTRT